MRNFGGGEINIIGQVTVNLTRGEHCCQAVLLVQKGTQLEMFLGTDLRPKLGFSLIENNKATDLVTGLSHKPRETSDTSVAQDSKQFSLHKEVVVSSVRVTVHLLNTAKVPGCHYRTVEVQIDNTDSLEGKSMLFSPRQDKED